MFGSGIQEMEKMISDPKVQQELNKNPNLTNLQPNSNTNTTNNSEKKPDSNPFSEAFKDMTNTFNMPGDNDPLLNMFKDGGDKDGFLKNLYGVLGKLSNSSENSGKMSKEELYQLFESLFDILMLEDMSTPLNQIKSSVNEYLAKNKSKINEEEEEKYKCVNKYIDTILIELKRAQPDKKLIIETFQKLHEMSDFGSDIFPESEGGLLGGVMGGFGSGLGAGLGELGGMGGMGGMSMNNNSKSGSGSDLKDIADKFFKSDTGK